MKSTFGRASVGFLMLTLAILIMSAVALWAIETFADGTWWASVAVVIVGMCAMLCTYASTLHEPIYAWIKEPAIAEQRRLDQEETDRRFKQREADMAMHERQMTLEKAKQGEKPKNVDRSA